MMREHVTEQEKLEELAEEIHALSEIGENGTERVVTGSKIPEARSVVESMRRCGLLTYSEGPDGCVTLTAAGEEIARSVVRRHRLAEMLLSQVLALGEEITETTACQVEHILSVEVTDSVCAFLGHPPLCPHGKPIPRGDCCDLFTKEMQPLIMPLMDLRPGASGKVAFIRSLTSRRLDRVGTLGLVPGAVLRLTQRRPAVVVEIGHTTLALDREIADTVYVRPLPKGPTLV